MKIALIYQYSYPKNLGGGEKRLYEIFSRFEENIDWYSLYNEQIHKLKNLNYKFFLNKKLKRRSISETILWVFFALKIPFKNYDILHVGQMPFFHLLALLLKQKIFYFLGIKTPIISIDWWEYWGKYWNKFYLPKNIIGIITEKIILKLAKNIIVISSKSEKDIIKHTNAEIRIIHNGVNLEQISNIEPSQKSNFIFFGRIEDHKRVDLAIDVFRELVKLNPLYTFNIIGDGPQKKILEEYVKKHRLSQNISFLGRVESNEEMFSIIKGSDCGLFFNSQEGGGSIALFEANACGVPVAHSFTSNGIDKNLITENNGFYFDNFNKINIANHLHSYIIDKNRVKKMRESSTKFVEKYDWDQIAVEYKNYFSKLIKIK